MGNVADKVAVAILAKVPLGYGMTDLEATAYARAAMKAMREGDNRMWRIGANYFSVPDSMPKRMQIVRDAFRAIIDAALDEKVEASGA